MAVCPEIVTVNLWETNFGDYNVSEKNVYYMLFLLMQ
jgi:hypothetical protein